MLCSLSKLLKDLNNPAFLAVHSTTDVQQQCCWHGVFRWERCSFVCCLQEHRLPLCVNPSKELGAILVQSHQKEAGDYVRLPTALHILSESSITVLPIARPNDPSSSWIFLVRFMQVMIKHAAANHFSHTSHPRSDTSRWMQPSVRCT